MKHVHIKRADGKEPTEQDKANITEEVIRSLSLENLEPVKAEVNGIDYVFIMEEIETIVDRVYWPVDDTIKQDKENG